MAMVKIIPKILAAIWMALVVAACFLWGCSTPPITPPGIESAPATLATAQTDAKAAASSLRESARSILASSGSIRGTVGVDPLAPRIAPQLDSIETRAHGVEVQAAVIDPGVTGRLAVAEQGARDSVKAIGDRDAVIADLTKQVADLKSLTGFIPWALVIIVAGVVVMAIKLYPPLSWVPGELGAGIAGGGLLVLVFILTWASHPWIIIAGSGGLVLALVVPTIVRLNTHPALVRGSV